MARWVVYELKQTELGWVEAPDLRQAEAAAVEQYGSRVARVQAVASIQATKTDLGSAPRQRARKSPVRAR